MKPFRCDYLKDDICSKKGVCHFTGPCEYEGDSMIRPVLVWNWEDAPERIKEFIQTEEKEEKSPQWLAVIPPEHIDKVLWGIDCEFLTLDYDHPYMPGWKVRIGYYV